MFSFSFHRSDFGGYLPLSDQLKFQQTTGSVLRDHFSWSGCMIDMGRGEITEILVGAANGCNG
jgi:hypothetical protein